MPMEAVKDVQKIVKNVVKAAFSSMRKHEHLLVKTPSAH